MNITNSILYLAVNLFHVYVFYCFYDVLLPKSSINKYVKILSYLIFYIANSCAFLFGHSLFLNLVTSVLPLISIALLYSGPIRNKLFISILVYVASMLLDSIVFNVILQFQMNTYVDKRVFTNAISSLLLFLFGLVIGKFKSQKHDIQMNLSQWIAIVLLPVGSMVIVVLAVADGYSAWNNIVVVAVLLMINALVFWLFDKMEISYAAVNEANLLKQQNEAYIRQFDLIQRADRNILALKHDLNNHFSTIKSLALNGDLGHINDYLAELSNVVSSPKNFVATENFTVDSILNFKLNEAQKIGSAITVNVNIPKDLPIEPYDISVILGNLLDNAIDALKLTNEKQLTLFMRVDRGVLFISTANTYHGAINAKQSGGKPLTTKKDKDIHGLGLTNIENTVEKYDGLMKLYHDNGLFRVELMMYLPE